MGTFLSVTLAFASSLACTWHVSFSPNPYSDANVLNGVAALGPRDAWAVGGVVGQGNAIAEHWDGERWSLFDTPSVPGLELNSVYMAASNNVWAVGSWENGEPNALILHWNGSAWSLYHYTGGGSWFTAIEGDAPNDIWAVGVSGLAAHFDGTNWTAVSTPNVGPTANLNAVEVFGTHDAWASGFYSPPSGGRWLLLSEHWGGGSWKQVPTPGISGNDNYAYASVAAHHTRDLWMLGDTYNYGNSTSSTETAYFDGSSWTLVPSPNIGLDTYISGAAAGGDDNTWAFGKSYDGTKYAPYAMQWNGSVWTSYPGISIGPDGSEFLGGSSVPGTANKWAVGSQFNQYGLPNKILIENLQCS